MLDFFAFGSYGTYMPIKTKKVFSSAFDPSVTSSTTGLVQQTVQIVVRFAHTI